MIEFNTKIDAQTYPNYLLFNLGYSIRQISKYRKNESENSIVRGLIPYIVGGYIGYVGNVIAFWKYKKILDYVNNHKDCDCFDDIYNFFEGQIPYYDIIIGYYFCFEKNHRGNYNEHCNDLLDYINTSRNEVEAELRIINERIDLNPEDPENNPRGLMRHVFMQRRYVKNGDDNNNYNEDVETYERWHKPLRY